MITKRNFIIALCVASMAVLGGQARADSDQRVHGFEASVGPTTRWMTTSSIDPVTAKDSAGFFSATVGYGLGSPLLGEGLTVVPEVSYALGTLRGTMFSSTDASLRVNTVTAGIRVVRPLWRSLSGYGRAGLGLAHGQIELDGGAMMVRDGDWSGMTTAALGFEAKTSTLLEVGLRVELGYAMAQSFGFDATRDREGEDDDVLHIPTAAAALGDIDPDGFTFRVALSFGF